MKGLCQTGKGEDVKRAAQSLAGLLLPLLIAGARAWACSACGSPQHGEPAGATAGKVVLLSGVLCYAGYRAWLARR